MIRLFVPDPLQPGARLVLAAEQAHYLTNVMRRAVGEAVLVFNGRDGEWRAIVAEAGKRGCAAGARGAHAAPGDRARTSIWSSPWSSATRLETIVEKAAELGARRVRLVDHRAHQRRPRQCRRGCSAIAVEAAEQTGRLDVPADRGAGAARPACWTAGTPARRLVFCDEAGDARAGAGGAGGAARARGGADRARGRLFAEDERAATARPAVRRRRSASARASCGPTPRPSPRSALWQAALGDWACDDEAP